MQATRHAEMEAFDDIIAREKESGTKASWNKMELFVTCEPCIMCAAAISILGT